MGLPVGTKCRFHNQRLEGNPMKKEQLEVLNVMQQVLRHVLISVAATDPTKTEVLATMLSAAATSPKIEAQSRLMLLDLAEGLNVIASIGKTRQ